LPVCLSPLDYAAAVPVLKEALRKRKTASSEMRHGRGAAAVTARHARSICWNLAMSAGVQGILREVLALAIDDGGRNVLQVGFIRED
jgi:hypothetical protein